MARCMLWVGAQQAHPIHQPSFTRSILSLQFQSRRFLILVTLDWTILEEDCQSLQLKSSSQYGAVHHSAALSLLCTSLVCSHVNNLSPSLLLLSPFLSNENFVKGVIFPPVLEFQHNFIYLKIFWPALTHISARVNQMFLNFFLCNCLGICLS